MDQKTMRIVKIVVGALLVLYGATSLIGYQIPVDFLNNAMLVNIVMLVAGYFLIMSGKGN